MNPTSDILPPHDDEAEAGALACILSGTPNESAAWFGELTLEDFYDNRHRVIFAVLSKLRDSGKPMNSVALYQALSDSGQLEEAGGREYVTRLPDLTHSPAHWPAWLERVRNFRQSRTNLAESVRLRECALAGVGKAEPKEEVIQKLAALPLLEYERERERAAERLGCRTSVLDKLVEAKRPKKSEGSLKGHSVNLADVEPWKQAVDGAEVLSDVADRFRHYVFLPDGAADALALWGAHSHAFRAFQCSPRLNIRSEQKGCGKTTLRDAVSLFVPRPLLTENLSVAVLFRLVEAHAPTVLADEYDAWLRDNEELRGMLNAGHRRGGQALRCEGDSHEVRAFNVFSSAVLCGIGALPGTLHDRSIVIRLERAKPGELRARFDSRHTEREQELCRKLARWTTDNFARLESSDPALPPNAFNRLADNWRPLFAVAEIAGGDWPQRAAQAFAKLTGREDTDAQGIGVLLLSDIQIVFNEFRAVRMFSKTLVDALCAMSDRPWPEAHKGKRISDTWLARRLRAFNVSTRTLRIGDERAKGYEAADFTEAFARYLPGEGETKCDSVTTADFTGPNATFGSVTAQELGTATEPHETPANIASARCHGSNPPLVEEIVV